jgi:hypothetical protein
MPKIKLTPAEIELRKKQRAADAEKRKASLPYARIDQISGVEGVILTLDESVHNMKVSFRTSQGGKWNEFIIYLDDLVELSQFISALICRYNFRARKANEVIHGCQLNNIQISPVGMNEAEGVEKLKAELGLTKNPLLA